MQSPTTANGPSVDRPNVGWRLAVHRRRLGVHRLQPRQSTVGGGRQTAGGGPGPSRRQTNKNRFPHPFPKPPLTGSGTIRSCSDTRGTRRTDGPCRACPCTATHDSTGPSCSCPSRTRGTERRRRSRCCTPSPASTRGRSPTAAYTATPRRTRRSRSLCSCRSPSRCTAGRTPARTGRSRSASPPNRRRRYGGGCRRRPASRTGPRCSPRSSRGRTPGTARRLRPCR